MITEDPTDWTNLAWVQSYARDWANLRAARLRALGDYSGASRCDMVVFRERNSNIYHICSQFDWRWRQTNVIYAQLIKSEPGVTIQ